MEITYIALLDCWTQAGSPASYPSQSWSIACRSTCPESLDCDPTQLWSTVSSTTQMLQNPSAQRTCKWLCSSTALIQYYLIIRQPVALPNFGSQSVALSDHGALLVALPECRVQPTAPRSWVAWSEALPSQARLWSPACSPAQLQKPISSTALPGTARSFAQPHVNAEPT